MTMGKYFRLAMCVLEIAFWNFTLRFYKLQKAKEKFNFIRAGLTDHIVQLGDARVHYWSGGRGEPFVLVPTFADSKSYYSPHMVALSKDYFLVVPDLVWFGESTSDCEDYSIDFQTQTIMRLVDYLSIDQFSVMGACYGGLIAYQLATHCPERVRDLVICGTPVVSYSQQDHDRMLEDLGIQDVSDLVLPQSGEEFRRLLQAIHYNPPRVPTFILNRVQTKMFTANRFQRASMAKDFMKVLCANECKGPGETTRIPESTLLIWGSHDPIFPLEVGQRTAQALTEKAEFRVIDRARHAPNLEHPKVFDQLILEFLSRTRGRYD